MPLLTTGAGAFQAVSSFTPASLTGLIGWWKADTGVTGSPVTAVADQSGVGHNLVNAGTVPFNATGFNGHPAFDFSAANDAGLSANPFAIGTGNKGSVFVIGQMLTGTASGGRAACYSDLVDAGGVDYGADGSSAWIFRDATNNAIQTYRNGLGVVTTAISLATNYVLGCIYDGTNVTHYVNGATGSTTTINKNWVSAGTFAIGNGINAGGLVHLNAWDGPIAEVIVTNADNTANVAAIYAYAQSKYGI